MINDKDDRHYYTIQDSYSSNVDNYSFLKNPNFDYTLDLEQKGYYLFEKDYNDFQNGLNVDRTDKTEIEVIVRVTKTY